MTPPLRLLRVANPALRAVLRSPLWRLVPRRLVLLRFETPRGHRRELPVIAVPAEQALVVLAVGPAGKQWWRSFTDGRDAIVVADGRELPSHGEVLIGEARREALRSYLAGNERAASVLGLRADPSDDALDGADAAVVRFIPTRSEAGSELISE